MKPNIRKLVKIEITIGEVELSADEAKLTEVGHTLYHTGWFMTDAETMAEPDVLETMFENMHDSVITLIKNPNAGEVYDAAMCKRLAIPDFVKYRLMLQ